MKIHTSGFVLRSAGLIALVLSAVLFLHNAGPLTRSNHRSGLAAQRGITDLNDPKQLLAEADRLAWMFNSQAAAPLYARAEKLFARSGDEASAIHARVGLIRAQAETMSFVDISQSLAAQLEKPVVKSNPRSKLWVLAAKGYTDIEIDVAAAKKEWEEARSIAVKLGEKQWVERADGELGTFAFLEGDSTKAAKLAGGALLSAMVLGDLGGQIRFLEMIGNGLNEEKRYDEALYFFNRAISLAQKTDNCGFPFMAYEGKADALRALGKADEAQLLLQDSLSKAEAQQKQGHAAQVLILLGELSEKSGNRTEVIRYLEAAGAKASQLRFYRMVGQAMFDLAKIYREEGDVPKANARLSAGLEASRRVGDRYYVPRDLTALAELRAQEGNAGQANALYDEAEDVIDGIMANLPGPYAESSIGNAMSETYLKHFELTAKNNDVGRAFRIVERIRGRTVADVLRSRSVNLRSGSPAAAGLENDISGLQVKLMQSTNADERAQLLEALLELEERLAYVRGALISRPRRPLRGKAVDLKTAQASLMPDELLLEYVLDEPRSFCLAVSRTHAEIDVLPAGRKEIEDLTKRYLEGVRSVQFKGLEQTKELYAVLFRPLADVATKSRLTVVADGELHLLPFDALVDDQGRYVVHSHVVSYSPSATVLSVLRGRQEEAVALRPFLGVGGIVYDKSQTLMAQAAASNSASGRVLRGLYDLAGLKLPNLSQSKEEVLQAGRLAGSKSVFLMGSNATKSAFESEPLKEFRVIHFAVHSVTSPKYPERDALVLAKDERKGDDGLLQVREILNLPFKAGLVTLSACDTGANSGHPGNPSSRPSAL